MIMAEREDLILNPVLPPINGILASVLIFAVLSLPRRGVSSKGVA